MLIGQLFLRVKKELYEGMLDKFALRDVGSTTKQTSLIVIFWSRFRLSKALGVSKLDITEFKICKKKVLTRWDHSPQRRKYLIVVIAQVSTRYVKFKHNESVELCAIEESPLLELFRQAESIPVEETKWYEENKASCIGDFVSEKKALIAAIKCGSVDTFIIPVQMKNLSTFVIIDGHHRAALTLLHHPGSLKIGLVVWQSAT